jgi:hypothetical protein
LSKAEKDCVFVVLVMVFLAPGACCYLEPLASACWL